MNVHAELSGSSERSRPRGLRALIAGVVVGAVISPSAVWAAHSFTDVPDTHGFHDDISAIADAGITTGYLDGTYRPSVDVTRGQMAGFMRRGFGRVASSQGNETSASALLAANGGSGTAVIRSVSLDAGATGGGGGYVLVTGTVSVFTSNEALCPCRVSIRVDDGTNFSPEIFDNLVATPQENGWTTSALAVSAVFPIAADATETYDLRLNVLDANLTTISYTSSLSAVYIPFDGTGVGLG
jgi:hypothetical protein